MTADEYSLLYYIAANGRSPFKEWLCFLTDANAMARVQVRLDRLRMGNFGEVRSLGRGLSELRIDIGPGYRVYFIIERRRTILLLCGGDKATQPRDIRRAREYASDYRRRTDA